MLPTFNSAQYSWDVRGFSNSQHVLGEIPRIAELAISTVTGVDLASLPPYATDTIRKGYQFMLLYGITIDTGLSHSGALFIALAIVCINSFFRIETNRFFDYFPGAISIRVCHDGECEKVDGIIEKVTVLREQWGDRIPIVVHPDNEDEIIGRFESETVDLRTAKNVAELCQAVFGDLGEFRDRWLLSLVHETSGQNWLPQLSKPQKERLHELLGEVPSSGTKQFQLDDTGLDYRLQLFNDVAQLEVGFSEGANWAGNEEPATVLILSGCVDGDLSGLGEDRVLWENPKEVVGEIIHQISNTLLRQGNGNTSVFIHFLSATETVCGTAKE